MKDYITGSQLRQYLHISTRKMKYLMDYNLIPHENTGQPTHKYRILRADAEAFKCRMEQAPETLTELKGKFSTREKKPPRHKVPLDQNALQVYLEELWLAEPDAIMLTRAVQLIGTNYTKLVRLAKAGKIVLVDVCGVKYIAKESLILYLITPEATLDPHFGNYKKILSEFKKRQCRVRENEKRRQKRASQRNNKNTQA